MAKNYYAIIAGGEKRIFPTWEECREFRDKNPVGAQFKGFATLSEAEQFLETGYGIDISFLEKKMADSQKEAAPLKPPFYAVKKGRHPGIYETWDACCQQIVDFQGSCFRIFPDEEKAKKWFETGDDIRDHCDAYTDGSFNEPIQTWGYGAILIDSSYGSEIKLSGSGQSDAETRNIAGELHGALCAVEEALRLGYHSITIYHDYEGVGKWATHEWRAKIPLTKWYVETMDAYAKKIKIQFCHVPAHTGVFYNERVDVIAKAACGISE